MMRKSLLIAVALMIVMACSITAATAAADSSADRVIVTSGNGEVIVSPDRAEVSLAVQTENVNAKTAQNENALKMNACMNELIEAGFAQEDLQTSGYTISPVYDTSATSFLGKVKYYQVTNTLTVKVKDITRTGDVVDIAVTNGANQVNSIRFMLSETLEQSARVQALNKAVAKTQADANTVAAALGVKILGVRDASVGSSYSPVMYDSSRTGSAEMLKAAAVPTPISPSDLTVSASVTVTYSIQ